MDTLPSPQETLQKIIEIRTQEHLTYVADASGEFCVGQADLLYVFDTYGNQFLDLSAGDGTAVLGHRNDRVIDGMRSHMVQYIQTARSGEHVANYVTKYAKLLSETFPEVDHRPQQVLFCTSDWEARNHAVEMARAATGRPGIVMTSDLLSDGGPTGPAFVDWENVAAVLVELVTEDMTPVDEPWARMLTEAAERAGTMVIVDESLTGYGRTGSMWAHQQWGIDPAITVLGGAGGGGLPFGAVVAGSALFDRYVVPSRLFGAAPVICRGGVAIMDQIGDSLLEHVRDVGHLFTDAVMEVRNQFPNLISGSRGIGLAQGLLLANEGVANRFFQEAFVHGLFIRPPVCGRVIPITPPLLISEKEMRRAVDEMAGICLDWVDPL